MYNVWYGLLYISFFQLHSINSQGKAIYILYKTVTNFYGHVGLNLVTLLYLELLLSMSDKEFCHIVIK
jgi:hypothetical protein